MQRSAPLVAHNLVLSRASFIADSAVCDESIQRGIQLLDALQPVSGQIYRYAPVGLFFDKTSSRYEVSTLRNSATARGLVFASDSIGTTLCAPGDGKIFQWRSASFGLTVGAAAFGKANKAAHELN